MLRVELDILIDDLSGVGGIRFEINQPILAG